MKVKNNMNFFKLILWTCSLAVPFTTSILFGNHELFQSSFTQSLSDMVFYETFDSTSDSFCMRKHWESSAPYPRVLDGDPCSDGRFLRILYDDANETHFVDATFDLVASGVFPRIKISFDVKLNGPDIDPDGDGVSFNLAPTSLNGSAGCACYGDFMFFAEMPKKAGMFGIGIDVYHRGPHDQIWICWDNTCYPNNKPIEVPIDLDNGKFHRIQIDLRAVEPNRGHVTITLTPNVLDENRPDLITLVHNLRIGDHNHPYEPYENRINIAGRNGGLDLNADFDNILVEYKTEVCEYAIIGDLNNDCVVDFTDFSLMTAAWLCDCNFNPDNPACIPK